MNQNLREGLMSLGLLVLRVGAGGLLLYGHGWGKLVHFSERASRFADPLHLGAPASLALVTFAEVVCALAVILGFATRLATLPVLGFLAVAVFIQHAADPWPKKELALIYLTAFLALLLTGPGRFSLDAWVSRRRGRGGG